MDVKLLKQKIREAGLTEKRFAAILGLTDAGYYARLRRQSGFSATSIYRTAWLLGLSGAEAMQIFFGETAGETDSSAGSE